MAKQFFKDLPDTTTPLTATRLNGLLDGEEALGNLVVDSIRSKNMFDGILEEGGYTNQGNKDTYTGTYRNANKVSVKPNTTYTTSINGTAQQYVMFYYDSTGTFLSNADNRTGTFTTPANCYYVNFRCYSDDYRSDFKTLKVQLEEGSNATNYMPYQNLDGKEVYSTGEAVIGTWINGKPLYRKVIDLGNLPNNTTKNILHNISNLDVLVNCYGTAKRTDGNILILPNVDKDGLQYSVRLSANSYQLVVTTGSDRSAFSGYAVMEYTKTTD